MPAMPRGGSGRNGSQANVNELSHDFPHRNTPECRAGLERAVEFIREFERRSHICIYMLLRVNVETLEGARSGTRPKWSRIAIFATTRARAPALVIALAFPSHSGANALEISNPYAI